MIAEEVDISVNPRQPLVGEVFDITFKIKINDTNKNPRISFNTTGATDAKVIEKQRGGESIRTVIINGKATTTKELIFLFKLVSNKVGTININDIINVLIDGKHIDVPRKTIQVVSERKKNDKGGGIFILATSSKKNIFVGEGIDVKYYLYSKVRMTGYDIKTISKIKRIYQEISYSQARSRKGRI